VIGLVCIATLTLELGLLVNINFRRENPESRDDGPFFYVFFRHLNLLAFGILFLPSTFMIEIFGVNRAITLGMIIGSMGMWSTYGKQYTLGSILLSCSLPFVANSITTVSSRWFGPKGRNLATGIMLISRSLPVGIEAMMDSKFEN
jgi:hypothetical protein